MAENTNPKGDRDDKPKVSTKVLIIALVAAVIAALALAFWLTRGDDEDGPGPTDPGIEQTEPGQTIPVPTTVGPGPGTDAPTTTPQEEIDQRAPTTFRGESHDHIREMEEEIGYHEPWDPMSPGQGTPQDLSKHSVQNMFTANLRPGLTWEENFHKFDRFYTEKLRTEGFKRWWDPAGPEHTLPWEIGSAPGSSARVLSFPRKTNEEWIAPDRLRISYDVNQIYRTDSGTTDMPAFKVVTEMVYTDDKWLLDDYFYPRGHEPSIH